MVYLSMNIYELIGFKKSHKPNKKYDAILKNHNTNRIRLMPFGDIMYDHYKDTTPLKLYSNMNHYDEDRRKRFQIRHHGFLKEGYYSPSFFSYNFLW